MNCLIIGKVWPEPTSTAAGRRTLDLITALQAENRVVRSTSDSWQIHFACAAQRGPHALDLEALDVVPHTIAINDSNFDTWITQLAPDVVIFDRFMTEEQFGWRIEKHCPEALRVLDTSDLHCLRIAREQALKRGEALKLQNEVALREIASIYRSDLTLMISEFEMEILRTEFSIPEHILTYWPFAVNLPELKPNFTARQHFILIGSFLHPPNLDAARWCLKEIWPKIRAALPDAELHCYGSYGDRYAGELNAPQIGFQFKGRAADALQTMAQYRINLAPLRYGAGLKGKVFDGFLTGTPTIMTTIAAEGIYPSDWAHDEIDSFAQEAINHYQNTDTWQERQAREHALCRARFKLEDWQKQLPIQVRASYENKNSNRSKNFVGQLLRHHQHRSTEFMSRWIEAKNK